MGLFEDTVVKAKDALDVAAKKTGEVLSVQKLKLNIATIKSGISKDYESLGRLQYDSMQNCTDNSAAMCEIAQEIERKYCEIEKLEAEISTSKKEKTCVSCGAKNAAHASYCCRCGCTLE